VTTAASGRAVLLFFLVLASFAAAPKVPKAQGSETYRVDTKESRIEIQLFSGGLLGGLGDNHLIALKHFSGKASFSPDDGWTADLLGESGSLKVIDPGASAAERKDVQDTMLGPTQLDVKNFPAIKLHSVSFDVTDHDDAWRLIADIELHGVTRKAQFSLECHQIGDKLQIRGKKMFKLTDFNMQPFSAALGAVKIKNEFEVTYNIVLERIY
jgi:polyisoprenoid-binding protein YceI